jgi:endonuclease/exonuclease/phosphatase family metal-dependent hydrolase
LHLLMEDGGLEREVTFVAAHLAAQEGRFHRRNADFQSLVQNLVFQDQTGIFKPNTPLFFLGDLNYRLSVLHPSRSGSRLTDSPEEHTPEELSLIATLKENILDFLETGKFSHLVRHDQLPLSPLALHLHEAPITFGPTYKYTSHDPPTYATTRTPSWTDRILHSPETILTMDYKSTTCATFSDHQAVSLTAILRNKDFETEEGLMPWDINPGWRERREFGEKLAYVMGAVELMGETKVRVILLTVIFSAIAFYLYF